MAKGKKTKKVKKSKTITQEDNEPDPNIKSSEGEFTLPNGDIYIGQYCAHRQGLIWREGLGIYETKDGQEYVGIWHDDRLVEGSVVQVFYSEGHVYDGTLSNDKYNGPGTYYYDDGVKISCNFEDNKPKGPIALIDPKGEVYVGTSRDTTATLLPPNVLFDNIRSQRGMLPHIEGAATGSMSEQESNMHIPSGMMMSKEEMGGSTGRTMEEIVFAKSTKTDLHMDFDQSDWYQDWVRFKEMKQKVTSTQEKSSSHNEDLQWLAQYDTYKQIRRRKQLLKEKPSQKLQEESPELLQLFQSSYGKAYPGVSVYYPSSTPSGGCSTQKVLPIEGSNSEVNLPQNGVNSQTQASVSNIEKLKPVSYSPEKHRKDLKNGKCLNKRNFGGGTSSLFNLANSFFGTTTPCTYEVMENTH